MESKRSSGFTILEISIVMVILGLMAMLAFTKYQKTVAHNYLEKEANGLYLELRSLRPIAFKYDAQVKARFNTSASQCTVWVDTSETEDAREYTQISLYKIANDIKIGTPSKSPDEWKFYPPDNNWKDSLCIASDSRGAYTSGAVYLYNPKLDNIVYCIGITDSLQSIELHKWNGRAWTTTPL